VLRVVAIVAIHWPMTHGDDPWLLGTVLRLVRFLSNHQSLRQIC